MASRDFTIDKCGLGFTIEPHTPKAKQWIKDCLGDERIRIILMLDPDKVVDLAENLRTNGFGVNS